MFVKNESMAIHLVSGGCGFVGRNLVKRLLKTTNDILFVVDDLSTGTPPETWLADSTFTILGDLQIYCDGRLIFRKEILENSHRDQRES